TLLLEPPLRSQPNWDSLAGVRIDVERLGTPAPWHGEPSLLPQRDEQIVVNNPVDVLAQAAVARFADRCDREGPAKCVGDDVLHGRRVVTNHLRAAENAVTRCRRSINSPRRRLICSGNSPT